MRIGLLQADHVQPALRRVHGDYPDLFGALFHAVDPGVDLVAFDVVAGCFPDDTDGFDLFVVTGSAASVTDDLPWIPPLSALVRRLVAGGPPLFGVCFGHQLIARALGGRVERAAQGWGVGIRQARIVGRRPWMDGVVRYALPMSHQDQVVALPAGAEVLATSDTCPIRAAVFWNRALTVQGHPEFTPAYLADLLRLRRDVIGPEIVDAALATLDRPRDGHRWARWALAFARTARRGRSSGDPGG